MGFAQNNSAFTHHGPVNVFWFANDALNITNAANDTSLPGNFSTLGLSTLQFSAGANALDTKLADGTTDATTIFGANSLVDNYTFANGGDPSGDGNAGTWPLDVLANKVGGN